MSKVNILWLKSKSWKLWTTFIAYKPTTLKPRTNNTKAGYIDIDEVKSTGSSDCLTKIQVQFYLQRSSFYKLPSSHNSLPLVKLSPQTLEQDPFTQGKTQPSHKQLTLQGSKLHFDEQPSWPSVFPSSHSSLPLSKVSPQIVVHDPFAQGWIQPSQEQFKSQGSIVHVAEQPSSSFVFPSSHCSFPLFEVSPQTDEQDPLNQGWTHPSHRQLTLHGSRVQTDEQPSWLLLFPSSHC